MRSVEKAVAEIIGKVRRGGDGALREFTLKYDRARIGKGRIRVTPAEIRRARREAGPAFEKLVKRASRTIARYHRRQLPRDALFPNAHGALVGWFYRPVGRAGVYVPGGMAPLVSTALMTIIPARVAGVKEIVVCTPPSERGEINPLILAACGLAGADVVCRVGGAQAVAAMAFGTKSVPKVDIIAGPGNVYVTEAKRQLCGIVGMDMLAGPSEIAVIADGSARPDIIAADLIAQAEHDPRSRAVLLATSSRLIGAVRREIRRRAAALPRRRLIEKTLSRGLEIMRCRSLTEAAARANGIAPEHLEIMVKNPRRLLPSVRNAGAVFIGPASATALGDYVAGPSHVLPTAGTARFSSGLSVNTFLKRISRVEYDEKSLRKAAADAERFASLEGLDAHAESIRIRLF